MESIRNFLKSWPGRIMMMLVLSPLVVLGLESYFTGGGNDNAVVTVGERAVSRDEYQNTLTQRRRELTEQGVPASDINTSALNNDVLENLIDRALLLEQSKRLGMHVSDDVIHSIILQSPQYLDEEGNFSNERFAFLLQQQGLTKDDLFNEYRQQLNLSQLYSSIVDTALFTDEEIKEFIALQLETRNVWVHRLPWENFKDGVKVTPEEIKTYYDEHQHELNSLAQVDLAYIKLDPQSLDVVPPTQEEIDAQYQAFRAEYEGDYTQQISQILITGEDAQAKMDTVVQRLNNGDDFAALAAEYSEDPVSRDKGGNIGTFNPDIFGEDAAKVAKVIDGLQAGDVSDPVQTGFGYQIFKVTEVSGDAIPSLDSVRDQLVEQIVQQKRAQLVGDKITRINEMAIDGLSITDIAQQESLPAKTLKDYTQLDNKTELNQTAVIEAAFDHFTIQDESVSTSISTDDSYVWVQPSNYRPVKPLSFEEATDFIEQTLIQQKSIEQALIKAKQIAATVNAQGMNAVNVSFDELGNTNRQSRQINAVEKAVVFSETVGDAERKAVAQATVNGASVLVMGAVKSVAPESITEQERLQAASVIRQRHGQEAFTDYLEYLKTAHKVKRNERLLDDVAGIGE